MVDAHPPEQGNLWSDPSLFNIYDEHRGVLREAQARIIDNAIRKYINSSGPIAEIGSGAGHLYSLLPPPSTIESYWYRGHSIVCGNTKTKIS
jgi:hypothetical protein